MTSFQLKNVKFAAHAGLLILCLSCINPAQATEIETAGPSANGTSDPTGQVTLPLDKYQQLLLQATTQPLPAPSGYAVGQSVLNVIFHQRDGHVTATVQARVEVETFEDEWTLVSLLSPGAALESASVNGTPVQLVQRAEGLFWLAEKRQKATVHLTYHVDSRFANRAYITSLPIPKAAATRFDMQIPQTHIDLAVAPAANLVTSETDTGTRASGTVPSTPAMMVSWRVAVDREYILSRADYQGALQVSHQHPVHITNPGSAIAWQTSIEAEMLIDGEVTVPLVSTATTLVAVRVDGEPATVFSDEGRFAVRLAGAGKHLIELSFLSPVNYPDGVPSSGFDIPDVPVSKFELTLDGDKLVRATPQGAPAVSVDTRNENDKTIATFFIPMSRRLSLTWMEAIPADVAVERRANAVVYQALHAAEGVLYGLAAIRYEITRGDANALEFSIPANAHVNHVTSPAAAIADWIVVEGAGTESGAPEDGQTHIRVFLNRAVTGEFILNVAYEQLLEDQNDEAGEEPAAIDVPILRALDVARQKGMVATGSQDRHARAKTGQVQCPDRHADFDWRSHAEGPGQHRERRQVGCAA
jgi:hypothetical protein